ncbi:MAG: efflux RND transporter periplasmic adaptor subunit [Candidatus Acidulodesulfobacterium sp.]
MRKKRIFYGILTTAFIMAVLSLSLSGCSEKSAYKEKAENKISVAAYKTEYTLMPNFLKSPGNTDSLNNTVISAHIMGYIVMEDIHQGQPVNRGELLLKLSAPEIASKYYAAKAGFVNAKKTYDRIKRLYAENSVSRQTYDNTLMQYNVAKADLNEAGSYLNYKNIYSPINGIIVKKNVSMGDLVAPGQMLLMIQGVKNLEFKTSVNVKYYDKIKNGGAVNLQFSSINKTIKGKIASVVRSANPYSHSVLIRISISKSDVDGLMPGMYGVAYLKIGTKKALIVPKSAVVRRLGITGVYIEGKSGQVMFQPVKKGPVYKKKFIVILNGLNPGMTVITGKLNKIDIGDYVSPNFAAAAENK